jgi:hypothetical protein
VKDVNSDGNADIVVFGHGPARLAMSYGNGHWAESALFDYLKVAQRAQTVSKRLLQMEQVVIADVNSDGKQDFAIFKPGSKSTPFLFATCNEDLHPKAPKHTCSGWLAGANVHDACVGKQSCTLQPQRKTWGDECPGSKHLRLSVQLECSDPDPGPKHYEVSNTKITAVSVPHTILLEVKPPTNPTPQGLRDRSVPLPVSDDEYKTLPGYKVAK